MFFYRIPSPDEVMLISGGKVKDNAPFRVVNGHGAFVVYPFRTSKMLTLASKTANVQEPCFTNEAFEVMVKAVIVFHVPGTDTGSIIAAGQRFVSEESEMEEVTAEIFAGHLRSIVGTLTLPQLLTNREAFEQAVLDSSKPEMARIGLEVDSLKIQEIDDGGRGYIKALSAPHEAALRREADVAQAEATRASEEAKQISARKQAEYARDTALRIAEYKAETDRAEAQAEQSGPLMAAEAEQHVLEMQSVLAQKQAALREEQLRTEVVKPAEAEAERVRIEAEAKRKQTEINAAAAARQAELSAEGAAKAARLNAEGSSAAMKLNAEGAAEAAKLNAEAIRVEGEATAAKERAIGLAEAEASEAKANAAAANDRVSLEQLLIENMPAIVSAATNGLQNANVTMFDGAEGYNKFLVAGVQQAMGVFNTLKGTMIPTTEAPSTDGQNSLFDA